MLHYSTVTAETLELLNKLQSIPDFNNLYLVGGTSLALQLGHRQSVDLDLFGQMDCDDYTLIKHLNQFKKVVTIKNSENIKIFLINDVKVDFVKYPYSWLVNPLEENNLKLAQKDDIVAMKLAAVTGRGAKKDFIDLYYLLKEYTLEDMLSLYKKKYPDGMDYLVLKSLLYFEDAEQEAMPKMFADITWEDVKMKLRSTVSKKINR